MILLRIPIMAVMQVFFKGLPWRGVCLCAISIACLVPPAKAQSTWDLSVSGFGGVSVPFSTDVKIVDNAAAVDLTATGARLSSSAAFGGKLTAWRRRGVRGQGPDLGIELDVTRFSPDLRAQTATATGLVVGSLVTQVSLNKLEINSTIVAVNLLARFPIGMREDRPDGRWYPYLGIGAGAALTRVVATGGMSEVSTEPAFQFLGGVKYFVTTHIGLFAEYKFTHVSHHFSLATTREDMIVNASHLLIGVAAHY